MQLLAERSLDLPRRTESPRHAGAASTRRPEIDVLRVVAMLLVFTVHTAEPFNPWDAWHVQSPERSKWLGQLVLFLAPWVMPLFMMLAGASAWHSLGKRTPAEYLNERVTRLIVPLTAGTLLLVPPQIYVDRRQRGLFDGSFLEFYPHFFDGIYPKGNFAWLHLWFLAVLGMLALVTVPLFRWLREGAGRRAMAKLARLCEPPGALLVLVLPMIALRLVLWAMFPHTRPIITDWANRVVLLPVFISGYVLAGDPGLVRAVDRQWKVMLAVGLVFSVAMFAWAWPGDFTQRFPVPFSARYVWFWSTYAVGGLAWPIALIGGARAMNVGASRVWDRSRELVNPFYMLHQTVIVLLAFAIRDYRAGAIASFFLLLLGAFVTTVPMCLLIRRTRVTRVLFGVRTDRPTDSRRCAPKP